jgi:long-chain acyl-CoA synthetase
MENKKDLWQPLNLADLFYTSTERFSNNEALRYKVGHHYERLKYFELKKEVIKLALALKKLGLKSGDKVILFTENRPEWVISDLALITLGVINVPVHSVLSPAQLEDIINEIDPTALIFSNNNLALKLVEIAKAVAKIPVLISFEKFELNNFGHLHYFKELVDREVVDEASEARLVEESLKIPPSQVTTIIYTSGTTGRFKGVYLTHGNFIFECLAVLKCVSVYPEDRLFSVLPLSHVFERTIGYYLPLYSGASIGYSTDISKLSEEIKERRPTIVIAVPRLFEKIHERINENVNKNIFKKLIFKLAFSLKKNGKFKSLEKLCEKFVFSSIRAEFGGQIRFFVSGGAALPPKLARFFNQVGLIILEGYGLTETAPVISCNRLEDYSFGTVGPVLEGIEVKISGDGEIEVKGPNISPGYICLDDNKVAFHDGWFKTGDYGYFDRKGFLVLNGRKRDTIVLSTGKKVSPALIEEQLEMSQYIDQAFVFGDARKHIGAIIVPNLDTIKERLGSNGRQWKNATIEEFLAEEVKDTLRNMASYEKIRKFIVQKEPFTVESGEMTPKFDLRRHVIYERNLEEIDKIYQQ